MGSLFRSEEMTLCQLFLQSEAAYACVSELGELGLAQFRDVLKKVAIITAHIHEREGSSLEDVIVTGKALFHPIQEPVDSNEDSENNKDILLETYMMKAKKLNPDVNAFQRKFVNEVRRCDEMERKLRFLEKEIKKDEIPMLDAGDSPDAPQPREMIDLEATFEKLENEMKEVNNNAEALKKNYLELTELKHILRKTKVFFDEYLNFLCFCTISLFAPPLGSAVTVHHGLFDQAEFAEFHRVSQMHDPSMQEETVNLLGEEGLRAGGQAMKLGFVAGVILRERIPSFERMLWRACRGNVFLRQAEIETPLEDPVTGSEVNKCVFIIFFQGDQLKSRVKKICEGFRATLYPCPETPADRREMALGVMTRIEDLNTVLQQTQDHRHRVLVAAAKNIKNWVVKVRKIKAIYHTLNLFNLDVTQKCLIAECWCAVSDLDKIQHALRRGTEHSGSSVPSILNRMDTKTPPPTYNRLNKFTAAFQTIVDAYGVANYREVNPAPYTIITFPFLFAVMFGDAWSWIIDVSLCSMDGSKGEKHYVSKAWRWGRYIILLMGLFSMYTGLIYNDIFSKSFNIFQSSWHIEKWDSGPFTGEYPATVQLSPNSTNYEGTPYTFGIDPVWQFSNNKILFLNSYKMKASVILGVTQMVFGVTLSLLNHRYFNQPLNILCEFIPQILFMLCLFGYLIFLIFWKWITYTSDEASCAPSLLVTLINMVLFNQPSDGDKIPCTLHIKYTGQPVIQIILVIVAAICIPWMLLVKPFILNMRHKNKVVMMNSLKAGSNEEVLHNDSESHASAGEQAEDDFNFGDIFVHQAIHTIEYCLGTISHTASYLRLWALSLAHAQLSEVLWTMVMKISFGMSTFWAGGIVMYFIFAAWAGLTIGVLLVMEGLSAFLHALRLHWVEFQNKFYGGDGYMFTPFSFEVILKNEAEE
ncbi:V-type proton ATPase subunit a isoform 1 [Nymphon striatum]|nr:V-type proton ATPase subunit a isoform 1 [Nymphon striatum]